MMRFMSHLLLACFALGIASAEDVAKPVKPEVLKVAETEKIAEQLGNRVTVRGKVSRTGRSKAGMQFLNFSSHKFVVVMFPDALPMFDKGEPADLYKDKLIEITGTIGQYKSQYQIKLRTPDQVKIIPEAKEPAEKAPTTAGQSKDQKPDKPATKAAPDQAKPPVDAKKFFDC